MAVTDPLPAGFEAVESWFNTTAQTLSRAGPSERTPWRPPTRRLGVVVAARRLRPRRTPRRSRPVVRHPPRNRHPRVQLRRARDDRRNVPDRAGARGGDVHAGDLRPHGDHGHRGEAVKSQWSFRRWSFRLQAGHTADLASARRLVSNADLRDERSRFRPGGSVAPPRAAAGRTARRPLGDIHARRRPARRAAVRSAVRRRHAKHQADGRQPSARSGCRDDRGRRPALLVASGRRSSRDPARGENQPRRTRDRRGGLHDSQQVAKLLLNRKRPDAARGWRRRSTKR